MAGRDRVVRHDQVLPLADPAQRHEPLAVLRRLHRVGLIEHARRARQLAHRVGDHLQRLRFVDPAGDDQHGVVRLVVLLVELRQPVERHLLEVFLRPDGRLAVVVPEVRRRRDALAQDRRRIVLAALELVADDGHLGVEDLLGELDVHHAIRLEAERPLQVVVRRRDGLVVVRPVVRGRAVPAGGVRDDLVLDLPAVGRLDEVHVLQQVRHAGLAVAFVPRAHQVGHVDRDLRLGRIGVQQHLQAVREVVLRDPAHGGTLLHAGREALGRQRHIRAGEHANDERELSIHESSNVWKKPRSRETQPEGRFPSV